MFRAKPKAPDLSDEPPVNSPETKSSESTTSEPVSEPATSQSQDSDAETKSVDPVSEEKPSDKNSSSTQPRLKDNSATEFVRAGQFIPVSMRSKLVDEVKEENKEPEKNVPETVSTAEKAESKILEDTDGTLYLMFVANTGRDNHIVAQRMKTPGEIDPAAPGY